MKTIHFLKGGALPSGLAILLASSALSWGQEVFTPCLLKFEVFGSISGTSVQELLDAPKFQANTPTTTLYMTAFDSRTVQPADSRENYGARITGFFMPQETGEYDFFLRSDDASQLFISKDDNPKNFPAEPQCQESGCCKAFQEPGSPESTSAPIKMEAGKRYALLAYLKEGGGGDYIQVATRKVGDPTPVTQLKPIPGALLGCASSGGTAEITQQPTAKNAAENDQVVFEAAAAGTPTRSVCLQWQRNGVSIPFATGPKLTIPNAKLADHNAKYRLLVVAPGVVIPSNEVTLTVTPDATPPAIKSASGSENFNDVTVVFSEPVTRVTASDKANYALDGGLTISEVKVLNESTARLMTSRQTSGQVYKLTVNGVKDTAQAGGLTVAPNTSANFTAWVLQRGMAKFESFLNIPGTNLDGLLDDPKFQANTPDVSRLINSFDSRRAYSSDAVENYGARISALFLPPETAEYDFFLRSDDQGKLFIAKDDSFLLDKMTQIAVETGCCDAFKEPGDGEETTEAPIALKAGQAYALVGLYKEGGGGDYLQVAVRKVGDKTAATRLQPIRGALIAAYANPDGVEISIAQQPDAAVVVDANATATFSVSALGTSSAGSTLFYQWQRAPRGSDVFVDIAGANAASYTTPALTTADGGAKYRVAISLSGKTLFSNASALTVGGVGPIEPAPSSSTIGIVRAGSDVVISWTGAGTLEDADTLSGPWTPRAGTGSPLTVKPTGKARFFRLKR